MAVPTEAYQSGFVQLPDFASTIQRGQQLGQQQQRLDLAAQKKPTLKKADKLGSVWNVHTPVFAKAWKEAMKKRADSHINEDMAGVASADRTLDDLRLYAGASDQQGGLWKTGRANFTSNPNKYTQESVDTFNAFAQQNTQLLDTDGEGNLTFDRKRLSETGVNPFKAPPNLKGIGDSLMEQFVNVYGQPQESFETKTDENVIFNNRAFGGALNEFAQDAANAGVAREEIERFYQSAQTAYPFSPYARFKETQAPSSGLFFNFGGKRYSGDYEPVKSTEDYPIPSTGDIDRFKTGKAYDLVYQGDKAQPKKTVTFKNENTGDVATEAIAINRLFKVGDQVYAHATGVSEKIDDKYEDVVTTRESGSIVFPVTSRNKNQIESMMPKDQQGNRLTINKLFKGDAEVKSDIEDDAGESQELTESKYLFNGEEYTLSQLRANYGQDFNPSEFTEFKEVK